MTNIGKYIIQVAVLIVAFILCGCKNTSPKYSTPSNTYAPEPRRTQPMPSYNYPPVQNEPSRPIVTSRYVTPDDAYDEGYDEGYEQGRYDGRHGYSYGHNYDDSSDYYDFYETRYQEGYEEGYDDGYSEGQSDYEDEQEELERENEEDDDFFGL